MDRRLSALSELMRADTENERRSAVRLIERETGKHVDELIRRGLRRSLGHEERAIALHLMETYSGDVMIQALEVILRRNGVSWQNVIAKGDSLGIAERIEHLRTGCDHPAAKRPGLEGVRRDAMPDEITGIPNLWEPGMDNEGRKTVVFYMLEADHQDRSFRPLVPFVARGDAAARVRRSANDERPITIALRDPGVRHEHIEAVTV
ncbi:hypothetical protein [uncultured Salinicola sp.]|uniref:hypothetical protein n=1 Tax=uncultured Salinicola sp. TaxID=1193542 RepID=UPI002611C78E|nr:hypothetical protein [uncultured Salinicola sp.]|tara:strand:- start:367 stop:984 length:618 start_codon:yes stop_codon:yes gene_type:complete